MTRPEPRSQVCDKLGIEAWSLIPGFQENLTQYLDWLPKSKSWPLNMQEKNKTHNDLNSQLVNGDMIVKT